VSTIAASHNWHGLCLVALTKYLGYSSAMEIGRNGSKRWTAQFRRRHERECETAARIGRACRRIGFAVAHIVQCDRYGIRCNGAHIEATLGGYTARFVVVLPSYGPDELQREALAADPLAVQVSSAIDAIRLLSFGIVSCNVYGRVDKRE
jgi:hypothetical protein